MTKTVERCGERAGGSDQVENSDGSRYQPAAVRSVTGPVVVLEFEEGGLLRARRGLLLLLAAKLQQVNASDSRGLLPTE